MLVDERMKPQAIAPRLRDRRFLPLAIGVLMATMTAAPASLFAGGAREGAVPELAMPPQPRQYLSPANEDSIHDELRLPFSEIVVPAENRVVVAYSLQVYDPQGALVWSVEERQTVKTGFFGRLFGGGRMSVALPESLIWDGTYRDSQMGDDGEYVSDGDYTYQVVVADDSGAAARTPPFNVTVDNTPPEVFALPAPGYPVFSPNDDGVRDSVRIAQSGSREQAWSVRIRDESGSVVWENEYRSPVPADPRYDIPPPEEVVWDGTESGNAAGVTVPEGVYRYELSSTDRGGNGSAVIAPWSIRVSLSAGDVRLTPEDGRKAFSPNGDGRRDRLPVSVSVLEPAGVAAWSFEVARSEDGLTVISREGSGDPPPRVEFDGLTAGGRPLPEGRYDALLSLSYENGTVVVSPPMAMVVDVTAPEASLLVDTEPRKTDPEDPVVFGGDEKPALRFDAFVEEGADWEAVVETEEEIRRFPLPELGIDAGEATFRWSGVYPGGAEFPDGVYRIWVEAEDPAGNLGRSATITARKDTRETPISLDLEGYVVSPNEDGSDDSVIMRPGFEVTDGIDEVHLEIRNERGFIVRSRYVREPFDTFEWFGENNAGQTVDEGQYRVDFQVIYHNGNSPRLSGDGPIIVDLGTAREPRTPPNIRISLSALPFSPDGDGVNDELAIRLEASSIRPIAGWGLVVLDPTGKPFRAWGGEGAPDPLIRWDGRDESGELVQSAEEYQATFSVWDLDENRSEETRVIPVDILVIRDGNRLRINIPSIQFAPFTADLFAVELAELERNLRTLRRLATILDRYPEYQILIEGHAAHVYNDEPRRQREQLEVLIPLSARRAEEVRQALIILGIRRDRMRARGVGGAEPVVPHVDRENRWKNRRVEFILDRSGVDE